VSLLSTSRRFPTLTGPATTESHSGVVNKRPATTTGIVPIAIGQTEATSSAATLRIVVEAAPLPAIREAKLLDHSFQRLIRTATAPESLTAKGIQGIVNIILAAVKKRQFVIQQHLTLDLG